MQTFLPYSDFQRSAKCLDRQRLGKQRVEAKQILLALTDPSYGWQNHPAVNMWRGFDGALALYGISMCEEWVSRGYKDEKCLSYFRNFVSRKKIVSPPIPKWLGRKDFHRAHQSNLLRKLPSYYKNIFGSGVPNNLPYVWPTKI